METLAHEIAGDTEDRVTLELARDAAEAELELARVRRVKTALIERMNPFGKFDVPKRFASPKDEAAWILQHFCGATLWKGRPKFAEVPLPAMPSQEPQRTAEAVRRALPDLLKLSRYEARAVTRRDHAIRSIARRAFFPKRLKIEGVIFCKTNTICCRIFKCLSFKVSATQLSSTDLIRLALPAPGKEHAAVRAPWCFRAARRESLDVRRLASRSGRPAAPPPPARFR